MTGELDLFSVGERSGLVLGPRLRETGEGFLGADTGDDGQGECIVRVSCESQGGARLTGDEEFRAAVCFKEVGRRVLRYDVSAGREGRRVVSLAVMQ